MRGSLVLRGVANSTKSLISFLGAQDTKNTDSDKESVFFCIIMGNLLSAKPGFANFLPTTLNYINAAFIQGKNSLLFAHATLSSQSQ